MTGDKPACGGNDVKRRRVLEVIGASALAGSATIAGAIETDGNIDTSVSFAEASLYYRTEFTPEGRGFVGNAVDTFLPYEVVEDDRLLDIGPTASAEFLSAIEQNEALVRREYGSPHVEQASSPQTVSKYLPVGSAGRRRISKEILLAEEVSLRQPSFRYDGELKVDYRSNTWSVPPNATREFSGPDMDVTVVLEEVTDERYEPPEGLSKEEMAFKTKRTTKTLTVTPTLEVKNFGELEVRTKSKY